MKFYKMLGFNIDSILLNLEHKISRKTKMAISKLSKQKKISVISASARMPKEITFLQKELGVKEPIICYKDALI